MHSGWVMSGFVELPGLLELCVLTKHGCYALFEVSEHALNLNLANRFLLLVGGADSSGASGT